MSRITDHHVISLFVGPIEEQPDGGFVRAIRWINRHGEESQLDLFAEAGPGCLRLHSDAERRLDEYALQARKPYTPPTLTEYPLTTTDYALPETQGTVDLAAEATPTAMDPQDGLICAACGRGHHGKPCPHVKPAMRSWNPADYTG